MKAQLPPSESVRYHNRPLRIPSEFYAGGEVGIVGFVELASILAAHIDPIDIDMNRIASIPRVRVRGYESTVIRRVVPTIVDTVNLQPFLIPICKCPLYKCLVVIFPIL